MGVLRMSCLCVSIFLCLLCIERSKSFISFKIYTFVALVTNIFCDTGILALQQGVKTAVLEMWVISCILGSH